MQLFPKSLNKLPFIAGAAGALIGPVVIFAVWFYATPKNFQVGYEPTQPVPYSHRLHAGQMGMDCRYCHANVEKSAKAMIPATQTCMGCHTMIRSDSAMLAPVRKSWETGKSVEWVQINKLPDHVYFNHSVHVAVGVGCKTCHGRHRSDGGRARGQSDRHGLVPRVPPRLQGKSPSERSESRTWSGRRIWRKTGRRRTTSPRPLTALGATDESPTTV